MKSILSAFGGSDGKTALIGVQATVGVLTFLGLAVWHVVAGKQPFDMMSFATAFGLVLGASAAAIGGHDWLASKADAIPSAPTAPTPTTGAGS